MKISNKVYDTLKLLCPILGALGALYVALAEVWGLPYATEISGTLSAIVCFFGTIMNTSSKTYWEENSVGSDIENLEDGGQG